MNERITALREHLSLCEKAQRLLSEERSFIEAPFAVPSDRSSLTDQRKSLLQALQISVERLRGSEAAAPQWDPPQQAEYKRLVAAAREATLAVLQQQGEVESLMLRHSLRRPKLDEPSGTAAPATAARLYRHTSPPKPEKPFDSRST